LLERRNEMLASNNIQKHPRLRFGLILTIAALMSAAPVLLSPARRVSAQAAAPSWSFTGNLNIARSVPTATLLQNGKVLVAGGSVPGTVFDNFGILKSCELFDPATETWSLTGNLNTDRAGETATLLPNGKVLLAGGWGNCTTNAGCLYLNSAELFDPATGTWSTTGNLNTTRTDYTATLLPNGKVLVAAGLNRHRDVPDVLLNSAELYDPATGTWSMTGSLNAARFDHTATLLPNGKVLVAGGGFAGNELNSAELYDPTTETWSTTGNLNESRSAHTATLLQNGKVLVAGNLLWCPNECNDPADAEIYDPATGTWSVTGNPGSFSHTATLLSSGKVLLVRNTFSNIPGGGCELYDPAAGTWSETAHLNTARNVSTAPLLPNGKVLVAGGGFAGNELNSAELYDPAATPGPNTVQFSSSSYTVSEGSPRVDITLSRSGDTTSGASVGFATNDNAGLTDCNVFNHIASPRCDYENTIGTMSFAAGETSKTFSVAIIDDSYAEGNETFTIGLNSPSGATLGAQSTATVTIIDNDDTNGANPIDNTNFFVRQQYIDFLGREPDPPGFAGWTSTINNCAPGDTSCDRIHVSQLFFQSEEFQSRGYFVYRFYPVVFGRKPDYAEFVPDLARVSGFLDANQLEAAKVQFIADFMARPAFNSQYNSLSNSAYVDALINTAAVNLSNRQALIDSLTNGTATRAAVLRQIVESSEVSTKYNHQAFAVMEYFGYLRRQPDAFYLDWITALDQGGDARTMVNGFVNSSEYRQRFGP
jgi:Calx-beta domain/Kelch motif/Galactose oxidase, central domain